MPTQKTASPAPHRQYRLSKSRLLSFLQCPKRLHLSLHRPGLAEEDEGAARRMARWLLVDINTRLSTDSA